MLWLRSLHYSFGFCLFPPPPSPNTSCHGTHLLRTLHWLPVSFRVKSKILTIVCKALQCLVLFTSWTLSWSVCSSHPCCSLTTPGLLPLRGLGTGSPLCLCLYLLSEPSLINGINIATHLSSPWHFQSTLPLSPSSFALTLYPLTSHKIYLYHVYYFFY